MQARLVFVLLFIPSHTNLMKYSTPTLLKVANGNGRFYDPRLELATWHISANLLENVFDGYLIDRFD